MLHLFDAYIFLTYIFILVNDDDSEEDEAPRRKKTRAIWDESESEESDRSWGRRKRKSGGR